MPEYIGIGEDDRSKPIYRIISFDRLVRIFQSNQMSFVKPEKWDDPYENLIAKTHVDLGTSQASSLLEVGIRNDSHGNCWTQQPDSDAIWRIYSSDKKCVRIESTPKVISSNIKKGLCSYPKSRLFIGKVDYIPDDQIKIKVKEFAKKVRSGVDLCKAAAESLLFKRKSFEHEDEVRVLIIDQDGISKHGVLNVKVDPHHLIQSVEIDSRAPKELVDVYKVYLEKELIFKGNISQSPLYDKPRRYVTRFR